VENFLAFVEIVWNGLGKSSTEDKNYKLSLKNQKSNFPDFSTHAICRSMSDCGFSASVSHNDIAFYVEGAVENLGFTLEKPWKKP
jgi:hypothetical protein